jgi:putative transposase
MRARSLAGTAAGGLGRSDQTGRLPILEGMARETQKSSVEHSLVYQLAWCTRDRRPLLDNRIQPRLRELIEQAVCPENDWRIGRLKVDTDYVYVRVKAPPADAPARVAAHMMERTQQALRAEFPALRKLPTLWAGPYYVVTAGRMTEPMLREYAARQPRRTGIFR